MRLVGIASALVTYTCVLCTLRTQISRSTINMQLYTLQVQQQTGLRRRGAEQGRCILSGKFRANAFARVSVIALLGNGVHNSQFP
jgi:hypothetical protein